MRKILCVLAIACASAVYAEDVTITSRVTHNGTTSTATSYIATDHARFSQPDGDDIIVDLRSGDMTMIDNAKKQYSVMTQKDMDDMMAAVKEQMNSPEMKAAQEQMKNLPPEQRKRIEAMMGGAMQAHAEKLGTSRTIAGVRCEDWKLTIGQFSTSEQCVTNDIKLPPQAWDRYKKFQEMSRSMMGAMGPMAKNAAAMREELAKMKGFPLASKTTTSVMGRSSESSSEVTSIKYGPVPSTAWNVPAGYKQVESPMKKDLAQLKSRSR